MIALLFYLVGVAWAAAWAALFHLDWESESVPMCLAAAGVFGVVGACIHCLKSFETHYRKEDLDLSRWWLWYLLRPTIGMGLGLILFTVVSGLSAVIGLTALEPHVKTAAALGGMAGMATEQATRAIRAAYDRLPGGSKEKP